MTHLYTFCRYLAALLVIYCGFAILNGAQFTILESELDRPVREASGFWLTWYYFGYSWYYASLIALVLIGGGVLLMFRKTTLLGASVLAFVIAGMVLISFFYGLGVGTLLVSLLIAALLAAVISFHIPQLLHVFWTTQNPVYTEQSPSWTTPVKIAVCSAIVLVPAFATYYLAHHGDAAPTPLDGRWEVIEVTAGFVDVELPTHIYFERHRPHLAVLRFGDRWIRHHFEVDTIEHRLSIYDRWPSRGSRIFDGLYRLDNPFLNLDGYYHDMPVSLDLIDMNEAAVLTMNDR